MLESKQLLSCKEPSMQLVLQNYLSGMLFDAKQVKLQKLADAMRETGWTLTEGTTFVQTDYIW